MERRLQVSEFRIEKDPLGEMRVPVDAYYGAQTARAVTNLSISGLVFPRGFIRALGLIKRACARVNLELGDLEEHVAQGIIDASSEVADGRWDSEFVVEVFQTGSGTSTNMNANEVIANRAAEILGETRSAKAVHPNDDVNMSQSSNDVFPTAIHVSVAAAISEDMVPALEGLRDALRRKSVEFDGIVKSGRTHYMDATPVRLGQEFGGYAQQVGKAVDRALRARDGLLDLPLGGTAVGTGLNRKTEFPAHVIAYLSADYGIQFREAENHFEAQGARDACVEASGELKTIACSLMKIANDLRWLASGPRTGIAEITLPAIQPGSSIMPGKVNPVLCEAVTMVAAQVIGNDAAITLCGITGNLELNLMMPLLAYDLLQSIQLLASVSRRFAEGCVEGIIADKARLEELLERNLALATALAPALGYDRAAEIAKEALKSNRSVREVAQEWKVLPERELDELLDVRRMTAPLE
jgi:fumarate hydratase, class II